MPFPCKQPERIIKGWGWEDIIVNSPLYCAKILHFYKNKKCSWHFHKIKDEVFYLQSGKLIVRYNKADSCESLHENNPNNWLDSAYEIIMNPGDSFHVKPYMRHQMEGFEESNLYEVSTTHYDYDSYRVIKGD